MGRHNSSNCHLHKEAMRAELELVSQSNHRRIRQLCQFISFSTLAVETAADIDKSSNVKISSTYCIIYIRVANSTTDKQSASYEWQGIFPGPPPQAAAIVFGDNCLALVVNDILYATFLHPERGSNNVLKSNIFSLAPASDAHFFRRASHGQGHKHSLKATTDADSPIGLPSQLLMWPATHSCCPATSL